MIVFGIIILLFAFGCKGGVKKDTITDIDVRKGIEGLKMEFLPNAPPQNVFENGNFPISLKIKNIGAFDIVDNKNTPIIEKGVVVFGFERAFMDIRFNKENIFEVKGKSIFSPNGDEEFIAVNAEAKNIGPQSETHPSTIFATACYPYETILGTSICIDTDVLGQRKGQKACNVKDLVFNEGQGAPVAVTKIETRMLPQDDGKIKPHFLIHIENKGNGEVVNTERFRQACTSKPLEYADFNTLNVSISLSGVPLKCDERECTGTEKECPAIARLRSKKGGIEKREDVIRCTYEKDGGITSTDAYTSSLKIELDYGYTFTISKDIIIEKVLTY